MFKKDIHRIMSLIIFVCVLISGCGGGTTGKTGSFKEKKPFDNFGDGGPYTAEVHTPEETVKDNNDFISKLSFEEGIGDFKLTPLKYGDSAGDFWIIVENGNDYPAAAYVTLVMKDNEGNVICASDNKTRVLKPGSRDIIKGNLSDDIADFEKLEITATIRDGEKEGIYETLEQEDIKEVGNSSTGDGRRLDLEYNVPHGWVTTDVAVFYDSDDNVLKIMPFVTTGETGIYACCYTGLYEYSRFEIFAWKNDGEAGRLPGAILSDSQKAGYISECDKDYESLDGNISYRFDESADGKTLVLAKNLTDSVRSMRMDEFLIYSEGASIKEDREDREYKWNVDEGHEEKAGVRFGEEAPVNVRELYLKPGEEIIWDTGIGAGEDFYMLPFSANVAELPVPEPEMELAEADDGRLKVLLDWVPESFESVLRGTVLVVYRTDDEIVNAETLQINNVPNGCMHYELETEYNGAYDAVEAYLQYHYIWMPEEGV
ncbi:MAG: hypothetical protein K5770_12060 [Lachnospiraceae bacterium]|nr:hypothetical protein [Lachnospiraceae bacterium]